MRKFLLLSCGVFLLSAVTAHAAIVYTSDPTLGDFTTGLTFATFITDPGGSDKPIPYTPTAANVASGFRVIGAGGGAGAVVVEFTSAVSSIRIFPNIDHFGAAYDGYQYTISGSNDDVTFTPLFDALTVVGGGEPFTLGTFTGTAPTSVNNVLTAGAGPGGTVGYEANFVFSTAYKFFALGASSEAIGAGNADEEFSAVGTAAVIPEPASWTMLALLGVFIAARYALTRFRRG